MKRLRLLVMLAIVTLTPAAQPKLPAAIEVQEEAAAQPQPDRAERPRRAEGVRAQRPRPPQSITERDEQPFTPGSFEGLNPDLPTLIMAGDSTAATGSDAWHRGWAAVLIDYFDTGKINVVNRARGGRSFRSFTREGLWDQILEQVKPGDIVLIQFGHNDLGDIHNRQARADLAGLGNETAEVTRPNGEVEIVHTFGWYTRKYVEDVRERGGKPILLTLTAHNKWRDGEFQPDNSRQDRWTHMIARAQSVPLLDLNTIVNAKYAELGEERVREFFPADWLHTSTHGAIAICEAFVAGVKSAPGLGLAQYLNETGRAIAAWQPTGEKTEQ